MSSSKSNEKQMVVRKFSDVSQYQDFKSQAKQIAARDEWLDIMEDDTPYTIEVPAVMGTVAGVVVEVTAATTREVPRVPITPEDIAEVLVLRKRARRKDMTLTSQEKDRAEDYVAELTGKAWFIAITGEGSEMRRICQEELTCKQIWEEFEKWFGGMTLNADYNKWYDRLLMNMYDFHKGNVGTWMSEIKWINSKLKEVNAKFGREEFELVQMML